MVCEKSRRRFVPFISYFAHVKEKTAVCYSGFEIQTRWSSSFGHKKVKLDDINVYHRKYYLVKADVRHRFVDDPAAGLLADILQQFAFYCLADKSRVFQELCFPKASHV
jgi:hypothetical protein